MTLTLPGGAVLDAIAGGVGNEDGAVGEYVPCPERVQGCTLSAVPGAIIGDLDGENGACR